MPKADPSFAASEILLAIFDKASESGLSRAEILSRADIHSSAVSRALRTGDCRLSTVVRIAKAANVRLAIVSEDGLAEKLLRGEVF